MIVSADCFKGMIAYWAYAQCPGRRPRNFLKVMDAVENIILDKFQLLGGSNDNFRYFEIYDNEYTRAVLELFTRDSLMSIPEFVDWNLSENEIEQGIRVDDPARGKYAFTSRYDTLKEKDDFVDLDAFISNVTRSIIKLKEDDE